MSYETAPATQLVATHCAVCNRPLVDSVSVESGIGPDCRARYGYDVEAPPEVRARANRLVHEIAAGQHDGIGLIRVVNQLAQLGFSQLAERIASRLAKVRVSVGPGGLWVRTPFDPAVTEGFRRIPGRRWDGEHHVNIIPETRRRDLWNVLRAHFSGALATGPKGLFLVE